MHRVSAVDWRPSTIKNSRMGAHDSLNERLGNSFCGAGVRRLVNTVVARFRLLVIVDSRLQQKPSPVLRDYGSVPRHSVRRSGLAVTPQAVLVSPYLWRRSLNCVPIVGNSFRKCFGFTCSASPG